MMRPIVSAFLLLTCAAMVAAQSAPSSRVAATGDLVLSGQTVPVAKIEVPASVRGIVAELNVKEGQPVKKGDQLARLDDELQRQKVESERLDADSTLEVEDAQNQLKSAQAEYEKFKASRAAPIELSQKEADVKHKELTVKAAQEKAAQSKIHLREETITLERMTLRSTIDGSVLRVNKQVGEMTDENPVIVVVQTSKLNAIFYPPKELFGKIAVGDKVTLTLGKKSDTPVDVPAVVVAVDPIIDPASQIFRVKLELDNAQGKLPAGIDASWNFGRK